MPFIVTTKRPVYEGLDQPNYVAARVAVATLEEAKAYAAAIVESVPAPRTRHMAPPFDEDAFFATALLPESGGSVGPLPDGTVIEVERHHLATMAGAARVGDELLGRVLRAGDDPPASLVAEVLEAFNANQAA